MTLPESDHQQLVEETFAPGVQPEVAIDLVTCEVGVVSGPRHSFVLDERARAQLLSGLDTIGETLEHREEIQLFRSRDRERRPWIYRAGR